MTWLPVVGREMRVAARRRATYRIRFWAVVAMLGLFAFTMLDESNAKANASQAGRDLLQPLTFLAFIFAMSIGVIATSDSVSEEKREGTLGLLFLTDLRGHDVILGKLVAHSLNGFYALVAILPILGMPLLLGGVSLVQFLKLIIALISAIVLSLAAGIFVSTRSRNERKAMVFSFLLLAAITCIPFVLMIWLSESIKLIPQSQLWRGLMFSPGFSVLMSLFGSPPFWPALSYWYGVGLSWVGAIGFLLDASRTAPRSWTERAAKPVARRVAGGGSFVPRERRSRRLLDDNPFLWLAMRGEASRGLVWFFVLSIFVMWVVAWAKCGAFVWSFDVALPTVMIVHVGLKIWVVGEASRRFVEDRRNNAMEFLLSTPLDERQIIRGQWRALIRQFSGPIVAMLLWETVMVFAMIHSGDHYPNTENKVPQLMSLMFFLPMDVVALAWIGMWLGMTSKGRGRAMIIGLAVVVVLPCVLTQLALALGEHLGLFRGPNATSGPDETDGLRTGILVCLSLVIDFAVIIWTQARLLTGFRRLALSGGR